MSCSSFFWVWFMHPFAQFLGTVTLAASVVLSALVLVILGFLVLGLQESWRALMARWRRVR